MHLALVVATEPTRGDFTHVVRLAHTARRAGHDVALFLMADAAVHAADPQTSALLDDGCDIFLCATSAEDLHVTPLPGITLGSQDDHARLVAHADRVLAFT